MITSFQNHHITSNLSIHYWCVPIYKSLHTVIRGLFQFPQTADSVCRKHESYLSVQLFKRRDVDPGGLHLLVSTSVSVVTSCRCCSLLLLGLLCFLLIVFSFSLPQLLFPAFSFPSVSTPVLIQKKCGVQFQPCFWVQMTFLQILLDLIYIFYFQHFLPVCHCFLYVPLGSWGCCGSWLAP